MKEFELLSILQLITETHSFIHSGYLYGASRNLLRGALSPAASGFVLCHCQHFL